MNITLSPLSTLYVNYQVPHQFTPTSQATDIYKNSIGRNLADPLPVFGSDYLSHFRKEHELKSRVSRPIEQVCTSPPFFYSIFLVLIHLFPLYSFCFQSRILYSHVVKEWMDKLEVLLLKYEFLPSLIFNMDETMLDASGYKVKVISRAQAGRPYTMEEAKLKHITLGLCISASGGYVRPLAILPVKTLPHLDDQVQAFYSISGQPNGFIDNSIWHAWVRDVFIPHVNNLRRSMNQPTAPVLFIVDSHSTRKHEPTIQLFRDNNIIVFILPAHSSTILQPLDLSCNGELKRLLKGHFVVVEGEDGPTKRNRLLHTAVLCLQLALGGLHIMSGFSRAGIHPFSKQAPLNSNLIRNPLAEITLPPQQKKKRGATIAGKILINGLDQTPALPPPIPIIPLPQCPLFPQIAPSSSSHQIGSRSINPLPLIMYTKIQKK